MICPHETAIQLVSSTVEMTDPNGEVTCRTCWKRFKNIGELAGDLSNQVKSLDAATRHLQAIPVLDYRADPQTGSLVLLMDGRVIPLRGPETDLECADEWHELLARQAREDAELLAERLNA
jgi:hypothetical protein